MAKLIHNCPSCGTRLTIAALRCADCGMELRNDFELSPFDSLSSEQMNFLLCFLKQRGNMSLVQGELNISYPTAKKRLDNLLVALNLLNNIQYTPKDEEDIAMSNWSVPENSGLASDIVKCKLMENKGKVIVYTARGLPCEVRATPDGKSFVSNKLPLNPPYRYEVFDVIVNLLVSQGGKARKGNGRNFKLGQPECDETTVVGAIGYHYAHVETGKSVYDPVFVLAAILEWAGIVRNERGELVLTSDYRNLIHC